MKTILPGGPEKRELARRKSALFREAYAKKQRIAKRDFLKAEFQKKWILTNQIKQLVKDLVETVCAIDDDDTSSTVTAQF